MYPEAGAAVPNTASVERSFRCKPSRDATGQEMTVEVPTAFLLANDQRPYPSPEVCVEPAKSTAPLLGAEPKISEPTSQVTIHFPNAFGHRLAPRPRRKVPD